MNWQTWEVSILHPKVDWNCCSHFFSFANVGLIKSFSMNRDAEGATLICCRRIARWLAVTTIPLLSSETPYSFVVVFFLAKAVSHHIIRDRDFYKVPKLYELELGFKNAWVICNPPEVRSHSLKSLFNQSFCPCTICLLLRHDRKFVPRVVEWCDTFFLCRSLAQTEQVWAREPVYNAAWCRTQDCLKCWRETISQEWTFSASSRVDLSLCCWMKLCYLPQTKVARENMCIPEGCRITYRHIYIRAPL